MQRKYLEDFIRSDPFFQLTFEPYRCPKDAPEIVRRMCDASEKANVGPMAAVAGAIAEFAVEAMVGAGAQHAIIDNGGDIALKLSKPVTIGVYTGESAIKDTGFRLEPREGITGVCTSSGTVGPSISLGNSDAATVFARDAALADAAATALGNIIKSDRKEDIEAAIDSFDIDGIDGFVVITHSHVGFRGKVPQFIKTKIDYDLITGGRI
jgi:hypothetical protein